MIYQYEMACMEAGMSEAEIKEIRKLFDLEYKRLQRENERRERYGIEMLHLEGMIGTDGEEGSYQIADTAPSIEEAFIHQCDLTRLNELLAEMDDADREFLLDCFDMECCALKYLSEKYEISVSSVVRRKNRLLKDIRNRFFEN